MMQIARYVGGIPATWQVAANFKQKVVVCLNPNDFVLIIKMSDNVYTALSPDCQVFQIHQQYLEPL